MLGHGVDESSRFRNRARECRELAKGARDDYSRAALNSIAIELDAEADKIDAKDETARRNEAVASRTNFRVPPIAAKGS